VSIPEIADMSSIATCEAIDAGICFCDIDEVAQKRERKRDYTNKHRESRRPRSNSLKLG